VDAWKLFLERADDLRRGARHGEVLRASFDVPGIGLSAIVKDATGAAVGWITPAPAMSGQGC
jgi:hypothetical protein